MMVSFFKQDSVPSSFTWTTLAYLFFVLLAPLVFRGSVEADTSNEIDGPSKSLLASSAFTSDLSLNSTDASQQ